MEVTRVFDLLPYQAQKFPKEDMLATKINGTWKKFSTQQVIEYANYISLGLINLGIEKDDKLAIISFNRPEWNFVDYGIQQVGAVSVPIYPTITEEDYKYILNDSEVKAIFVATSDLYAKIKNTASELNIQHIYSFDSIEGVKHLDELIQIGSKENIHRLTPYKNSVTPDDLLTLIYTSGTTGQPKGVMLTHNNLISNVKASECRMPVDYNHRALSFLPLCHVYERMLNYIYSYVGVSIYYAESLETISDNLKEVKPHIFVTVPRLLEKVYDKIYAKGKELIGIKKKLFFWALELGLVYDHQKSQGFWYDLQLKIANKLIFNKWRDALGGNIRAIVSGGAALQPRLARVFNAAQINILEGYGLTETSPTIAVNCVDKSLNRVGTVGTVLDGIEVKIAEDGEILTRGPHIMKGYFKKPELTAEVIDAEGWFHTGDIGTFIENKFLKITDRKKEIFKTSGGKYITPQLIENKFKESEFIEQIMVVGEGEKFPAALVIPSFEQLKNYCEFKNIPFTSPEEVIKQKDVIDKFEREFDKYNEDFAQYEKLKKFVLLSRLFSIESGELTPTLKLKRKIIKENYKKEIESMFDHNL